MDNMENTSVSHEAVNDVTTISEPTENLRNSNSATHSEENMMTREQHQEELNRVVGAVKQKERERLKNQQAQPQSESSYEANAYPPLQRSGEYQAPIDIAAEVEKALQAERRELEEKHAYQTAESMVNSFSQKLSEGKGAYENFDQKVSSVNLNNPDLFLSLNDIDNPADVIMALSQDPQLHLQVVNGLSNEYARESAKQLINLLSNNVKNNQSAKKLHNTNKLPSSIKSSPVSTGNARASHAEMRNNPKYMF